VKKLFLACSAIVGLSASSAPASQSHELPLKPEHVHWGYYSAAVKPVLRIASGDTVRVETMVAGGLGRLRAAGVPDAEIPPALKAIEVAVTDRGAGVHPLSGPIWVRGAERGHVLEVKFLSFEFLHAYGVTGFIPNSGTLPDDFPYARFKLIRFDRSRTAQVATGVTIPLAPFFGSVGVAPDPLAGRISSGPPGSHTGNLDNKELVAGSTLYLPVHVPGALLSLGDGHAAQGDGEVSLTGLETSLRGAIQVTVRTDQTLRWPRAETPSHFIMMGLHPDLDEAARLATREVIDFLVNEKSMSREDAYLLCSLAVDLRVTQLVDGTKGVHAMIPKSMFGR
jgi:acetamidase/formamidase